MKKKSAVPDLSRRHFIGSACCAAVGTTGLLSTLASLRLIGAAASPANGPQLPRTAGALPSDYKALVCLFLNGGNDANNLIVPTGSAYAAYAAARSNLALPQTGLLPISPKTSDGRTWGLHAAVPELQNLFASGRAALLANVGTLVYPTTKDQYTRGTVPLPPQLFSHSDQQVQWQHSVPDKPTSTGWGGRTADLLNAFNENNEISMSISLAGKNTFQVGNVVSQYAVNTSGAATLAGSTSSATSVDGIRFRAQKDVFNQAQPGLVDTAFAGVSSGAITSADLLNTVLAGAPVVATPFPNTTAGNQLKMAARLIAASPTLGLKRQVFFVQLGGWDTHAAQLENATPTSGAHASLLAQTSQAINAFYNATVELGVASQVTLFTASDFGRTYRSNGDGSDHGWGNHQFIVGGAVKGTEFYGKMPTLTVSGPDDTSQGRWIPTTSVDEYAATLATWFGVSATDLPVVLPNIGRFAKPNLGFL
ncbi:MAG TPA: DUF1501 domain-containing protein [Opitutaceae bacterium]|nr:DUF1501 domain-containing protein [Opitutaceae bacterium]